MLVRIADEFRTGLRDVTPDDMWNLALAWNKLNEGLSPAETVLAAAGRCPEPSDQ